MPLHEDQEEPHDEKSRMILFRPMNTLRKSTRQNERQGISEALPNMHPHSFKK